jgi:Dolichyl-phosphate-mannose-protein mannosyltransferase
MKYFFHDTAWNNLPIFFKKQWVDLFALLLILFFLGFNYFSMQNVFRTSDETDHLHYGANILDGNSDRMVDKAGLVDDSKMPISILNALPAKIALDTLHKGSLKSFLRQLLAARLMTVIFSGFVAWLVFLWSRSLYGNIPALVSLFLYIFDPNIIAHSQLVTTDIYAMGLITISFYWLWRFARERNYKNGLIFALFLGLSQIAKYTAIALLPLSVLALILHDWFTKWRYEQNAKKIGSDLLKLSAYALISVIICVGVINIGYLFNRSFTLFKDYHFESARFQSLQTKLALLDNVSVPTPYPYLQGLDLVLYRENTGTGYGNIYLLGRLHEVEGFKGYYFVASLFKVPLGTQIVLLASILVYFWDKNRRIHFWVDEVFLLLPVIFFTIYFNFFYNTQIGIRFYLIIFPLLYVFVGQLFRNYGSFNVSQRFAFFGLGLYLVISVFSYYPHYISYFNELVWDRKMAYQYLADSNVDWKQDKGYLDQYLKKHPEAVYFPNGIQAGQLIVSVNDLVGVSVGPNYYAWLRENFKPAGTIAYSYLIYNISQNDLDHLCETKSICSSQP